MTNPVVLCTLGPELRPLLETTLAGLADVRFLTEIDAAARPAALATADVLEAEREAVTGWLRAEQVPLRLLRSSARRRSCPCRSSRAAAPRRGP